MDLRTLAAWSVGLALVLGLARRLRGWSPGAEWTIRHRPGKGTVIRGRIARARFGAIEGFLERDLRPRGAILILGTRTPGGGARIEVRGALGAADAQRIRNFMMQQID